MSVAGHVGIMQGRLLPSTNGELQCSPGSRWPEEFELAAGIGLHHIELVADAEIDPANPLWSDRGREAIVAVSRSTGVAAASVCVNETLVRPFDDGVFVRDLIDRLTLATVAVDARVVVLPLLEASDVTVVDRTAVRAHVTRLAQALDAHRVRLAVELGVTALESARLVDEVLHEVPVGVCYDLGNAAAAGFDPPTELAILGRRVWHVHAKDKDDEKANVRFGRGRVPFTAALAALDTIGFDGLVTMEATRGDDPVVTAREHLDFLTAADRAAVGGAPILGT